MGCFHLGHVPGPVTRVAEIGAGPTCEKGEFLKLLWNIFLLQTINMVIVHEQVYWGTALILMWTWILHVLCGLLSRMQCNLFYAGSKSRRWAVVNECELTNHSGYLKIWRHMRFSCFWYYIAFAMAMSYEKLHIVLYYRLLRSCKAEVTWQELCGLQNSGLPILAN